MRKEPSKKNTTERLSGTQSKAEESTAESEVESKILTFESYHQPQMSSRLNNKLMFTGVGECQYITVDSAVRVPAATIYIQVTALKI